MYTILLIILVLKHKKVRSLFNEIGPNTEFKPIIVKRSSTKAKNILLCSGKISYDLEYPNVYIIHRALFEEK